MREKTEQLTASERKAAALRANLKRRKTAARKAKQRSGPTDPSTPNESDGP